MRKCLLNFIPDLLVESRFHEMIHKVLELHHSRAAVVRAADEAELARPLVHPDLQPPGRELAAPAVVHARACEVQCLDRLR